MQRTASGEVQQGGGCNNLLGLWSLVGQCGLPKWQVSINLAHRLHANNLLTQRPSEGKPQNWNERPSESLLTDGSEEPNAMNRRGHVVGHVKNIGHNVDNPTTRVYATPLAQPWHNDSVSSLAHISEVLQCKA